jgi:hypothetical protein
VVTASGVVFVRHRERLGQRNGRTSYHPPRAIDVHQCPSSVNQTVRLPRWRRAASYSGQFVIRCRCRGMWCRPAALTLNGTADIRSQGTGDSVLPLLPAGSDQPIRATRSRVAPISGEHLV